MAKYKVGDRVRIVNHRTRRMNVFGNMDKWFGKTMTIRRVLTLGYFMVEDRAENCCKGWHWDDEMIAGLAEPEKPADEDLSVTIHFHGRLTVAELCKNGRVVKVENARCNPKDEYSRSEGARIAVERLFQKKSTGKAKEISKPKVGDKFVVTGNTYFPRHFFKAGEIVIFAYPGKNGANTYRNERGLEQTVCNLDVKPYKGESK